MDAAISRLLRRHSGDITHEKAIDLRLHDKPPYPDGKYLIKGGGRKVWKRFGLRKEHRRLQGIWKGGPRLDGEPGDPEFIASYNRAVARLAAPTSGLLLNVLVKYQQTKEFLELAPRTQDDYREIIDNKIEPEFGDLPLAALAEKKCRGEFKDWRDRLALRSRRQADYAWTVLARILAVALDRGWVRQSMREGWPAILRKPPRQNLDPRI